MAGKANGRTGIAPGLVAGFTDTRDGFLAAWWWAATQTFLERATDPRGWSVSYKDGRWWAIPPDHADTENPLAGQAESADLSASDVR